MKQSSSIISVGDGLVSSVQLYLPRHGLLRVDSGPFLVYYVCCFSILLIQYLNGNAFSYNYNGGSPSADMSSEWMLMAMLILIPLGLLAHVALFLVSQTSPNFHVWIGNTLVQPSMSNVSGKPLVALVHAAPNSGSDRIVKIDTSTGARPPFVVVDTTIAGTLPGADVSSTMIGRMEFQKVQYDLLLSNGTLQIARQSYPTTASGLQSFLQWRGMGLQAQEVDAVQAAIDKWGFNEYDIPIPQFLDLYLTHLVAPFFVFQVLCLFLWSLDDYWIYSAFTLLMLMFFEGMMCKQRQNSLLMLRNMRRPAVPLCVFRFSQWVVLSSDEIVPGDVLSLSSTPLAVRRQGSEKQREQEGQTVPCDALLLCGSCVVNEAMLTGESVPQVKEAPRLEDWPGPVDLGSDSHIAADWRRHLLLSGTAVLIHSGDPSHTPQGVPSPPDGGCVAIAVRTGFGTTQGGLMRKILFARERMDGSSAEGGDPQLSHSETAQFIAILVVLAALAAAWVLLQGLRDPRRNRFRLALHCVMIVTSVVPPELPMELSLAVTHSLAALAKALVYCTEPFRIALAGKLDVCCFDKTGTLTQDKMLLKGVVAGLVRDQMGNEGSAGGGDLEELEGAGPAETRVMEPAGLADAVLATMGLCHDLLPPLPGQTHLTGDPLELATLAASGFSFDPADPATLSHPERGLQFSVLQRHAFSSALKRMSVVVRRTDGSLWGLVKGAPEVLLPLMDPARLPDHYTATAFHHMTRGKRVLAMGFKRLHSPGPGQPIPRSLVESQLCFSGFLVFDCDLKADSKGVVKELKAAGLSVVMITGDSVYTAAEVARKLGIVKAAPKTPSPSGPPVLILHPRASEGGVLWRSGEVDGDSALPQPADKAWDPKALAILAKEHSLCATGPALAELEKHCSRCGQSFDLLLRSLAPLLSVFARVTPAQKEAILLALNRAGLVTLMCGDGTNDVGALKAAHVGVSIVNDPELERRIEGSGGSKKGSKGSARDRMARAMQELQEQEQDPTVVKLGDASIASPFTCRRTSVDAVLSVIRQGRCTLVTTIQVYKILALNCLVSAFMMSALYLRGLKQGDSQMTAIGLVVAGLFFFLSQARPLAAVADRKPPSSVFAPAVGLSILGQFVVHLSSLLAVLALCERYSDGSQALSQAADGRFQPNLVNSAVFLLSALMQINNFVVNYRGEPFTQSLTANTAMLRTVQALYGGLLLALGGSLEPLSDLLQLAPFPNKDFQAILLVVLLCNFGAALAVEKLCQRLE